MKRRGKLPRIEVVDLFCGIGGLSYGMKSAGFKILSGYDLDWTLKIFPRFTDAPARSGRRTGCLEEANRL